MPLCCIWSLTFDVDPHYSTLKNRAQALWDRVVELNEGRAPPIESQQDVVLVNDDFLVIRDLYPKGTLHWLVLPRREMVDQIAHLTIAQLPLLEQLVDLVPTLTKIANAEPGHEHLEFMQGFHSVPSMKLLHMHFISTDLNGPRMTTPAHWVSFTSSFFIKLPDALQRLREGKISINADVEKKCKEAAPNCPKCLITFDKTKEGVVKVKEHFQTCQGPVIATKS